MSDRTETCVVGAGPAGLTLAIELGRAGRPVVVVETTTESERHFRGESIVPDAVWMLREMGLLEALELQGAKRATRFELHESRRRLVNLVFEEFHQVEKHPMEIPQTMLLGRMLEECDALDSVTVLRAHEVIDLVRDEGSAARVRGVRVRSAAGESEILADVIVGADGRYSRVRDLARIAVDKTPQARDVVWFRVPYPEGWEHEVYRVMIDGDRHAVVLPTFPDLLRVGLSIPKGGAAQLRRAGIAELHHRVCALDRDLGQVVQEHVREWSDTSVLDIFTARVPTWNRDGVVLVGDAAHTLSPVLGHGVNHAIQDGRALAGLIAHAGLDEVSDGDRDFRADGVFEEFQALREDSVNRSRSIQLRQESLFALRPGVQAFARRLLYRVVGGLPPLRRRVFGAAYFTVPQR